MYARVAQFEGVNVEAAMATMDEATAVIQPMLRALPGYEGSLELVSPEGKFISISLFETVEDAEAAEPTFDEEMPARLGHLFAEWSGRRVFVGRFQAFDSRG